eukprot:6190512-Pleurochrysis_carterae.AAC.1
MYAGLYALVRPSSCLSACLPHGSWPYASSLALALPQWRASRPSRTWVQDSLPRATPNDPCTDQQHQSVRQCRDSLHHQSTHRAHLLEHGSQMIPADQTFQQQTNH